MNDLEWSIGTFEIVDEALLPFIFEDVMLDKVERFFNDLCVSDPDTYIEVVNKFDALLDAGDESMTDEECEEDTKRYAKVIYDAIKEISPDLLKEIVFDPAYDPTI